MLPCLQPFQRSLRYKWVLDINTDAGLQVISIPAWLVILVAYQQDNAWYESSLIPLVIVWQLLQQPPQQSE